MGFGEARFVPRTRTILLAAVGVLLGGCFVGAPIVIDPPTLPDATLGQPYEAALIFHHNDVQGAYVFGDLPAGLTFNYTGNTAAATITGTPSAPGTFTFTVNAYAPQFNAGGPEGERQYTIVVR